MYVHTLSPSSNAQVHQKVVGQTSMKKWSVCCNEHVVGSPKWCFQSDELRCLGELSDREETENNEQNAKSPPP